MDANATAVLGAVRGSSVLGRKSVQVHAGCVKGIFWQRQEFAFTGHFGERWRMSFVTVALWVGLGLLALAILVMIVLQFWGMAIRRAGMRPITSSEIEAAKSHSVTLPDGRLVGYRCYGSTDPDSPVVVNIHGSGLEAGFEETVHAQACVDFGVRGIAISLPGCGFTDDKPGRVVKDWPSEDLAGVLTAEGVDTFHVTGHSQGTPHAMAAAIAYPDRCIGLGLNAPLLPSALVDQLQLGDTIGTGLTPSSKALRSFWMGWYFGLMRLLLKSLPPSIISSSITRGLPKVKQDTDLLDRFTTSMRRSVVRGTAGGTWETAQDTCFDWGIDVQGLEHTNACVWHADDDTAIPSFQGRWLADHLDANYRHQAEGYGHLTYTRGQYRTAEGSMVAQLLAGISG